MRKALATLTGLLVPLLLVAGPARAQTATGTVTVLHGIPGTPVDVYVNDELRLPNFQPETVTDPLTLPASMYNIKVRPAGQPTAAPILQGDTELPAGANASIIAHLDAAAQPKLTVFVNDTSKTQPGQGRLVVRHTAAAPAVDIVSDGQAVTGFTGLTNPNEAKADLPAATLNAAVAAAGTTTPVLGPTAVPVREGQATIVYAVGSLEANNLGALVQTIGGLHTPPAAVPAGNSGLVADGPGPSIALAWGAAAALTSVALGGGVLARRRVRAEA